jgi:uncharacterized membrane protein YqiK
MARLTAMVCVALIAMLVIANTVDAAPRALMQGGQSTSRESRQQIAQQKSQTQIRNAANPRNPTTAQQAANRSQQNVITTARPASGNTANSGR